MASQIEIDDIKILKDAKNWTRRNNLLLPALTNEEYFKLDNRSMSDMVIFTKKLVKLIRYYNLSNKEVGHWDGFLQNINPQTIPEHAELINKLEINELLKEDVAQLSSMLDPHEVLFLAFLVLMRHPKKQMNNFSDRYLDYYYRDYLGFSPKAVTPAQAHVVFELNKGVSSIMLEKGVLLSAGVDSERKEIFYEVEKDILITSAKLTTIQTLTGIDKGLVLTTIFDKDKDDTFTPNSFKTFGDEEGILGELGFAISSPILATSSGTRTLTLIFTTEQEVMLDIQNIFTFYLTGEKAWISLEAKQNGTAIKNEIQFTLNETIAYPKEYDSGIHFDEKYPILKAVLKDLKLYKNLNDVQFEAIDLKLEVSNISNLKMANDEVTLNSGTKLIHPFGLQPVTGSSFYFIHPDLTGKSLSELKLEMKWVDLPKSGFEEYYNDYFKNKSDQTIKHSTFTAKLNLPNSIQSESKKLFRLSSTLENSLINSTIIDIPECILSDISTDTLKYDNPLDWPEYFVLSLEHDFLHSIYPKVVAEAVMNVATTLPNSPYTPTCSSITVTSYTAKSTIKVQEELWFKRLGPWVSQKESTILPTYSDLGYLFLGITGLEEANQLTMLWQASNGAMSDNSEIRWEYWSKQNDWQKFIEIENLVQNEGVEQPSAVIIEDTTGNLSGSGIITFQIPVDISNKHPVIQGDQYWLRATLNKKILNDDAVNIVNTLDIKLHATVALFYKQNQTQDDFSLLKPEIIKNLVKEIPDIKKVFQPYSGFDGKRAENEQEFKIRASARLKHKNRAITAWDYERLVLAEFPEVYMVRTILNKPGELIVEIIMNTDQSQFLIWPQAPEQLLNRINAYLQKYKLASVELDVKNAQFTNIHIRTMVHFTEESQNSRTKLERDIRCFLSPWGNSGAIDLDKTNNKDIYLPEVVNFIKTRDYINQVESFQQIESARKSN